jgi:SAM-dependent methyltransferase
MTPPSRFDRLSASYDELLKDPIRDRFTGSDSVFFHLRKRDLIREFFRRRGGGTGEMAWLDLGCGKGELLAAMGGDFRRAAGCDLSSEMMQGIQGAETRRQEDPLRIPYADGEFDFITAVCVYHHVPVTDRPRLTSEICRVLKPGGILAIIEHNPLNPATRLIVSRTPVDDDAVLLAARETRALMKQAGLAVEDQEYFLYFPQALYRRLAPLERLLRNAPLGGQYAVFGRK